MLHENSFQLRNCQHFTVSFLGELRCYKAKRKPHMSNCFIYVISINVGVNLVHDDLIMSCAWAFAIKLESCQTKVLVHVSNV
jgi:hypothetical protein